mmetsp:Transcript_11105/g.18161  ORF Transcript_11105/g.18161 Transcript_11105/m.18161 type:complete len:309 (-) Transcript_11105:444-1370(-)
MNIACGPYFRINWAIFLATSLPNAPAGMKKLIRISPVSGEVIDLIVDIWKGTKVPLIGTSRHSFSRSTFSRLLEAVAGKSARERYTIRSFASSTTSSPSPPMPMSPLASRARASSRRRCINSCCRTARFAADTSFCFFSSIALPLRRTPTSAGSSFSSPSASPWPSSSWPAMLYETSLNSFEDLVKMSGTPSFCTTTMSANSSENICNFWTASGLSVLSSPLRGILCSPTDKLNTIPGVNFVALFALSTMVLSRNSSPTANPNDLGRWFSNSGSRLFKKALAPSSTFFNSFPGTICSKQASYRAMSVP